MINSALLSNTVIGDNGSKVSGKKTSQGINDLLLAGQGGYASFQTLLTGIGGSPVMTAQALTKMLATAKAQKTSDGLLPETVVTADLVTALKSLSPEQLAALNIDADKLAGDFAMTDMALEGSTLGILQSLSTFDLSVTGDTESFTIIDDPKMAAALAALAAQLNAMNANAAAPVPVQLVSMTVTGVDGNAREMKIETTAGTISIANLDADEFQALKKLAFSDIAPFLTQPRTVRLDNNSVVKLAQGPSFLTDGQTDATALTAISGLVPVFVKAQSNATGLNTASSAPSPVAGLTPAQHALALLRLQAGGDKAVTDDTMLAASDGKAVPAGTLLQNIAKTLNTAASSGTPLMVTVTPANAASRGFETIAKGLDNGLGDPMAFDLSTVFDDALKIHADQTMPSNSSTSLIAAKGASHAHPSTHLVSAVLQRAALDASNGQLGERQFVIQLDPPNMGRLKITLDFADNNTVKAKLLAERPETVSMLQKDQALLQRALNDSGFDTSANGAITFDLADNGTFTGGNNGQSGQENRGKHDENEDGTDFATIETLMPVFVDPVTGLTHVNVVI